MNQVPLKHFLVDNSLIGVIGSNCVVIAAEKYERNQRSVCSLNGNITVAWSGNTSNALMIVEKAQMYTKTIHGQNSFANIIAEFLIDPEIRVLNNLPILPYTESFMVASCDENGSNLFMTDECGTISHVLASATGKKSEEVTKFMSKNYSHIEKGIFGAIRFALKSLCIVAKPDPRFIEVSVTSLNRPFEIVDKRIVKQFLSKINQ